MRPPDLQSPPFPGGSPASRLRRLPRRVVCGREVRVATGFRSRLLGLALLDRDEAGPGLLIPHCSAVHTFGMRFALEVHFLGEDDEPLAHRLVPPRRFVAHRGARAVLEIPARGPCLGRFDADSPRLPHE